MIKKRSFTTCSPYFDATDDSFEDDGRIYAPPKP